MGLEVWEFCAGFPEWNRQSFRHLKFPENTPCNWCRDSWVRNGIRANTGRSAGSFLTMVLCEIPHAKLPLYDNAPPQIRVSTFPAPPKNKKNDPRGGVLGHKVTTSDTSAYRQALVSKGLRKWSNKTRRIVRHQSQKWDSVAARRPHRSGRSNPIQIVPLMGFLYLHKNFTKNSPGHQKEMPEADAQLRHSLSYHMIKYEVSGINRTNDHTPWMDHHLTICQELVNYLFTSIPWSS